MDVTNSLLRQAREIIRANPIPADARQQLEKLERQATGEEREYFADIWEAFVAAGGKRAR